MQLTDLSDVLAARGPFVTVLVDATSDVEQAAAKYDAEWKALLQQLAEAGVAEPVREALSAARGEHADGEGRLVVATTDATVRLSTPLSVRPDQTRFSTGTLPDLLPLVLSLTAQVPHVVVLADRRGADLSAYYDSTALAGEVTVRGRTLHLKKLSSGGWSQKRYLHTVEENWQANAHEIATSIASLAEQIDARLIVGAGDDRELALVQQALPAALRERWITVDGGRGDDGSRDLVQQRIAAALSTWSADQTLALMGDYAQERGQDKRAVDGLVEVVEALRKAQVQTLLLTTDPDQHSTLWFGDEPTQLGTTADEVTSLGSTKTVEGPMLAVLLRAALGTGAYVQVVPHQSESAPFSGIGALLRYADDSTVRA